ncbi:TMEM175 family protein [Oryzihumus leptocrescens]|uniref:Putative membrane protein n=1 Tax=Oryzihumus leptocrescens TaxID=297536 RepID=A0A542ZH77_9MICO|nr:TMEM175 family protein [Oryzihumus leptocrescens]TQL59649.1 putative membrane protein [Oryzihumus leptocrescens]
MGTGRLEAFSDGVMAVAITLLVLDLHASPEAGSSLAHQLVSEWPSFAAYAVSFFIIGIIWVNHHALMALVARVDRVLLFVNLVLLLFVTTIPFTTSTLAAYLREGGADARVAVVLYGISMEGMAVSFTVILAHLVRGQLMHEPVDPATGRRAVRRFGLGTLVYPLIVLVGLVSAPLMLLLYAVLAGFYVVEQTPILGRVDRG